MKNIALLFFVFLFFPALAQENPTEPMVEYRRDHQFLPISGDRAIAIGGYNGSEALNSTEIYTAVTNDWAEAEPMNNARTGHSSHVLENGDIVVFGGWNGESTNYSSSEIYFTALDAWEEGGSMEYGRSNHRSIELDNGKILITGGYDGTEDLAACELYDPETDTFETTGSMTFGRSSHTITKLANGLVLVTGGFNPTYGFQMNECEIYDPEMGMWEAVEPMAYGRDNHSAVVDDGLVVVTGGRFFNGDLNLFQGQNTYEVFDPSSNTWVATGEIPAGQSFHQSFNHFGAIHIPGSTSESGNGVETIGSPSIHRYDQSEEWTFWGQGEGRHRYALAILESGLVVVSGGDLSEEPTAYYYSFLTNIDEPDNLEASVYPNPTTNELRIDGTFTQPLWKIFNSQGQLLSQGMGLTINTSKLPNGMYQLFLLDGDVRYSTQFQVLK